MIGTGAAERPAVVRREAGRREEPALMIAPPPLLAWESLLLNGRSRPWAESPAASAVSKEALRNLGAAEMGMSETVPPASTWGRDFLPARQTSGDKLLSSFLC